MVPGEFPASYSICLFGRESSLTRLDTNFEKRKTELSRVVNFLHVYICISNK